MLKITEKSKIFILCPSGIVTGGAELLHQLADFLNNCNKNAYIVYFGNSEQKIPEAYSKYNIKTANNIEDNYSNIIVVYEGIFNKTQQIKYAQICLWWLSVDHFYIASKEFLSLKDIFNWNYKTGLSAIVKRSFNLFIRKNNLFKNNISISYLKNLNAINLYQSEYAQFFLQKNGFPNIFELSDYLNTDFQTSIINKERNNIILYNPKKGLKYTNKLIKLTPSLKWIPIQGMTRKEIIELFQTSKLYIDFGYHPGKDRLPREAALNGCCIITGKRGSANFFEDITIPEKYKFNEKSISKSKIISCINEILSDYDKHIVNFEFYKKRISEEKIRFQSQVKTIFNISD